MNSTASASPSLATLLDEVRAGHARGWCYVALQINGKPKAPRIKGWPKLHGANRASLDTALDWAGLGRIGILTGPPSGFVVVDIEQEADPATIAALNLPRTVTVITGGGGRHLYYLCPDGIDLRNWVGQEHRESGKITGIALHVDLRVAGGQVLSVGSIHPGTGRPYEWAHGLSPDDVPMAPFPMRVLPKPDLPKPAEPKPAEHPEPAKPRQRPASTLAPYVLKALADEAAAVRNAPDGQGNNRINVAGFNLGQLVGAGELPEADAVSALLEATAGWRARDCDDARMRRDIEITIRSGIEAGKRKPRRVPPARSNGNGRHGSSPPQSGRIAGGSRDSGRNSYNGREISPPQDTEPTPAAKGDYILVPGPHVTDAGEYIEVGNDEFAHAVLSRLPAGTLYRRSDLVGQIVGDAGHRKFLACTNERIRLVIDEHLRLGKWLQNHNKEQVLNYRPTARDVAALVLDAAKTHPNVRRLDLLCQYPVYTSGWTLAAPGWNDRGRVFYDPSPDIASVTPETDRETIVCHLDDLVTDFPFQSPADRENFLGLLLTPLIRPALGDGNVPMHMILSSLERTGKSKLAEVVFGLGVLGRKIPATQLSEKEEERRKAILAILLDCKTAIHLDNINEYLDSAGLASMLTASTVMDRVLSRSSTAEVENNLTIIASGNNVRATGEIVKRTVPIKLQPANDTPEARCDFTHPDLENYVTAARSRSLSVLLGMVEIWKRGGSPAGQIAMGGFERWAAAVGGILASSGHVNWMTNYRQWTRSANPQGEDLKALVEQWHLNHGTTDVTADDLLTLAEESHLFPECMSKSSKHGRLMSFTRSILSRHVDAPVGTKSCSFFIRRKGSGSMSFYRLEQS